MKRSAMTLFKKVTTIKRAAMILFKKLRQWSVKRWFSFKKPCHWKVKCRVKNCSNEAMKRWTLLKTKAMKLITSLQTSSLLGHQHYMSLCQNLQTVVQGFRQIHMWKQRWQYYSTLVPNNRIQVFCNCQYKALLHCFLALIMRQIRETKIR